MFSRQIDLFLCIITLRVIIIMRKIATRGNSCLLKRTKLLKLVERGFCLSLNFKILISFHKVELPQVGKVAREPGLTEQTRWSFLLSEHRLLSSMNSCRFSKINRTTSSSTEVV